jgi:hypothetical protein
MVENLLEEQYNVVIVEEDQEQQENVNEEKNVN